MNTNIIPHIPKTHTELEITLKLTRQQYQTLMQCINNAVSFSELNDPCLRILVLNAITGLFKRMFGRFDKLKPQKNSLKLKSIELAAFKLIFEESSYAFGVYERTLISEVLMEIEQRMA